MNLNVPAGITTVVDDAGNQLAIVGGQVDVEPHLVSGLLAQGFTIIGADSLTADAPEPAGDTSMPTE